MIILLNGAFGVGKTTTARLLAAQLPDAMLYDPELIGFVIRRIDRLVPLGRRSDDYQHLLLWRRLTVAGARLLRWRRTTLVVPMTLAWPQYYREIVPALRRIDRDLHHFCLTASPTTIQQRLLARGNQVGSWAWQQTERCVATLAASEYAQHIDTEQYDPAAVVELIRQAIGR